jgi:prepilin-type N-terminal cleavage/methylation domain-containing protein
MKKLLGYTLIELMVVIALIGILASVAIPAYQNYVVRARVTEGLELATLAKTTITEEIVANNGQINSGKMGVTYKRPSATDNVSEINIGADLGDITINYTAKAGNGTIIMHPEITTTGEITWTCTEGTLDPKYRPSNCR